MSKERAAWISLAIGLVVPIGLSMPIDVPSTAFTALIVYAFLAMPLLLWLRTVIKNSPK